MRSLLRFSQAIDALNAFIGRNVAWLGLIAVLVCTANAVARYALNIGSNAWLELQWYLNSAVFLFAAAYALRRNMSPTRKLWQTLGIVFVLSFAALLWLGREIYLAAPPIPSVVKTTSGDTLFTGEQIQDGQRAWLSAGGQQLGTVWGHGSYVAPDWSADWLHREVVAYRDNRAQAMYGREYAALGNAQKGAVDAIVKEDMRRNTYDAAANTLTVTPDRKSVV